jgi:hypothetical protein
MATDFDAELSSFSWNWETKDLATDTGMSPSHWHKARLRGDGPPYIMVGRKVRYSPQLCRKWLAERMQNSTSETPPEKRPHRRRGPRKLAGQAEAPNKAIAHSSGAAAA